MKRILKIYTIAITAADALQPLALLILRLWMAYVFWVSGVVKIEHFDTTLALFAEEYRVPLVPPLFAALSATAFELCCPLLLVLGMATRLATLPLLAMTAVIQFTYDQNIQHAYWAMLLFTLLTTGAGRWLVDGKKSQLTSLSVLLW